MSLKQVELVREDLAASAPHTADPYEAACAVAMSSLLYEPVIERRFANMLDERYALKEHALPSWALGLTILSAAHMIEWEHITKAGEEGYQPRHTNPQTWASDRLKYIIDGDEDNEDYYNFKAVLTWADLNTTKPHRRLPTEYLLKTYFADHEEPVDILDVGCSRNDILILIALNMQRRAAKLQGMDTQYDYSEIYNRVVGKDLPRMGQMIGIDQYPFPDNLIYTRWYRSNSLRFGKSHDKELVRLFDELGELELRDRLGVEQVAADFSKKDMVAVTNSRSNSQLKEKYDLVTISFMLYQSNEEKREIVLERAKSMLKPGAIIQITDRVAVDPNNVQQLYFLDGNVGTVSTLYYEEQRPELGYQEGYEWQDGELVKGRVKPSDISRRLWLPQVRRST